MNTVLVIDDEEGLRESIRDLLEDQGYNVVTAGDGQEALDSLAGGSNPCVVLLDLVMPRMNGWDFFAALRALPNRREVPVVVCSSTPNRAPEGATRVLSKPLQPERLLSVVREFCGG